MNKIISSCHRFACSLTTCSVLVLLLCATANAQHDADIYGVKIGMDVPTALETAFRNTNRPAGKERPDSKRNEGKDNKDVRVLYKDLKDGNLQIVFADGKVVKEIVMEYKNPLRYEDLRLPESSGTFANFDGKRYDDRYAVGFTSDKKEERYWWRDEKMPEDYRVRIGFISGKVTKQGALATREIFRKIISIHPDDTAKFMTAVASK